MDTGRCKGPEVRSWYPGTERRLGTGTAVTRRVIHQEGGEAGGVVVGVDRPVRGEDFILSPRGQGINRRETHRASQKEVDLVAVATLIKGSYTGACLVAPWLRIQIGRASCRERVSSPV